MYATVLQCCTVFNRAFPTPTWLGEDRGKALYILRKQFSSTTATNKNTATSNLMTIDKPPERDFVEVCVYSASNSLSCPILQHTTVSLELQRRERVVDVQFQPLATVGDAAVWGHCAEPMVAILTTRRVLLVYAKTLQLIAATSIHDTISGTATTAAATTATKAGGSSSTSGVSSSLNTTVQSILWCGSALICTLDDGQVMYTTATATTAATLQLKPLCSVERGVCSGGVCVMAALPDRLCLLITGTGGSGIAHMITRPLLPLEPLVAGLLSSAAAIATIATSGSLGASAEQASAPLSRGHARLLSLRNGNKRKAHVLQPTATVTTDNMQQQQQQQQQQQNGVSKQFQFNSNSSYDSTFHTLTSPLTSSTGISSTATTTATTAAAAATIAAALRVVVARYTPPRLPLQGRASGEGTGVNAGATITVYTLLAQASYHDLACHVAGLTLSDEHSSRGSSDLFFRHRPWISGTARCTSAATIGLQLTAALELCGDDPSLQEYVIDSDAMVSAVLPCKHSELSHKWLLLGQKARAVGKLDTARRLFELAGDDVSVIVLLGQIVLKECDNSEMCDVALSHLTALKSALQTPGVVYDTLVLHTLELIIATANNSQQQQQSSTSQLQLLSTDPLISDLFRRVSLLAGVDPLPDSNSSSSLTVQQQQQQYTAVATGDALPLGITPFTGLKPLALNTLGQWYGRCRPECMEPYSGVGAQCLDDFKATAAATSASTAAGGVGTAASSGTAMPVIAADGTVIYDDTDRSNWVTVGGQWNAEDNVCGYWRFSEGAATAVTTNTILSQGATGFDITDLSKFKSTAVLKGAIELSSETSSPIDPGERGKVQQACDVVFTPGNSDIIQNTSSSTTADSSNSSDGSSSSKVYYSRGVFIQCKRGSAVDIGAFHDDTRRCSLTVEMWVRYDSKNRRLSTADNNDDNTDDSNNSSNSTAAATKQLNDYGSAYHILATRYSTCLPAAGQHLWSLTVENDGQLVFIPGPRARSELPPQSDVTRGGVASQPGLIRPDKWVHVALTVDASKEETSATVCLYIDCEKVGDGMVRFTKVQRGAALADTSLVIGADLQGWRLTELRIWAMLRDATLLSDLREVNLGLAEQKKGRIVIRSSAKPTAATAGATGAAAGVAVTGSNAFGMPPPPAATTSSRRKPSIGSAAVVTAPVKPSLLKPPAIRLAAPAAAVSSDPRKARRAAAAAAAATATTVVTGDSSSSEITAAADTSGSSSNTMATTTAAIDDTNSVTSSTEPTATTTATASGDDSWAAFGKTNSSPVSTTSTLKSSGASPTASTGSGKDPRKAAMEARRLKALQDKETASTIDEMVRTVTAGVDAGVTVTPVTDSAASDATGTTAADAADTSAVKDATVSMTPAAAAPVVIQDTTATAPVVTAPFAAFDDDKSQQQVINTSSNSSTNVGGDWSLFGASPEPVQTTSKSDHATAAAWNAFGPTAAVTTSTSNAENADNSSNDKQDKQFTATAAPVSDSFANFDSNSAAVITTTDDSWAAFATPTATSAKSVADADATATGSTSAATTTGSDFAAWDVPQSGKIINMLYTLCSASATSLSHNENVDYSCDEHAQMLYA
jgi:hypothetical protein